ncbi:MAG: zinc-ribbon domain-containing protein [Lachnospiraceae bacterium]|nr:zinc-ribbon domain-containing protein [Lachnospiraceae bacterium]
MFCPNCGTQQPDGSQFCASCGANLGGTAGGSVQMQPQYANPGMQQQYMNSGIQQQTGYPAQGAAPGKKQWKTWKKILIGIGIFIVITNILGFIMIAIADRLPDNTNYEESFEKSWGEKGREIDEKFFGTQNE